MSTRLGFRHGVHPPESKDLTAGKPIRRMPFPEEVVLPLRQHTGKPARPLVKPGDRVERGDKIAAADGFVSVPIHASAAGVVKSIGWWPHADGTMAEAIRIEVERYSAQLPRPRMVPHWEGLTPAQVVAAVQEAGVVGLGGAAFPAHVKLQPPKDCPIEFLLVNGAECEPYLTSDHRVMVDYTDRVWFGVRIMMHALGVAKAVIGVEKNKPDAIAALRAKAPADLDVRVEALTVKYPQGAEKMLIKAVTGREVPSGKLPMHVGTVVQNVGSMAAIAEVFETGMPLIERIVSVTGTGGAESTEPHRSRGHQTPGRAGVLRRPDGGHGGDRPRRPHDGHCPARPGRAPHQGHQRRGGAHAGAGAHPRGATRASSVAAAWTPARCS